MTRVRGVTLVSAEAEAERALEEPQEAFHSRGGAALQGQTVLHVPLLASLREE